ncbi:MAG: beta-glucosidase [Bacteroidetes bacterium]|nr:beta-glucosidase [Bacteroidota bacterium]
MSSSRIDFPVDFVFGTATASFQIEGAKQEDGKGLSIWDTFCDQPGAISDGNTGETACDHYHRYPEDVKLLKELGIDSYRLSVSWPRIIPDGDGKVNKKGIEFYSKLIDSLLAAGITPMITLYHWDLPQKLEDTGGWTNRQTAYAFARFAEICFKAFSDRINSWVTLNEPFCSAFLGYGIGIHAPGISNMQSMYNALHHLNLAHGLALECFRKGKFPGAIGTTLNLILPKPASDAPEDILAADRAADNQSRMYLNPLLGKGYPKRHLDAYPEVQLPIQDGDMKCIAGKMDFLGINYYSESTAAFDQTHPEQFKQVDTDYPKTAMDWDITPDGLFRLLEWAHNECGSLPLIITENGSAWDEKLLTTKTGEKSVDDPKRIAYLQEHLDICKKAVQAGIPLKGYYAWSFIDNFEWAYGYSRRFGLIYCDYENLERIPKSSYYYYQKFLLS